MISTFSLGCDPRKTILNPVRGFESLRDSASSMLRFKNLEEIQNPEGDSISVATGETRGRNEKGLGETQT